MPTGYTCNIEKGITFQEYALTCARAFGALLDMRDDSLTKEIPEEFQPTPYYKEALGEAEQRLAQLQAFSPLRADEEAKKDYESALQRHKDVLKERAELKIKYLAMTAQVKAYNPPSDDHVKFKEFMLNQLDICEGDYNTDFFREPIEKGGKVWLEAKIQACIVDVAYRSKSWQEEQERCARNNLWVKQLRDSL